MGITYVCILYKAISTLGGSENILLLLCIKMYTDIYVVLNQIYSVPVVLQCHCVRCLEEKGIYKLLLGKGNNKVVEKKTESDIGRNVLQWLSFLFFYRSIHTIHSIAVELRT